MPNKCVKCGKIHPDDAKYLIDGCDKCGSKFFFFITEEQKNKQNKMADDLSKKQIAEMENDVRSILGHKKEQLLILSIEAIRILMPGKYELDLVNLFNQKPLVIKIADGKYRIDISDLPKKEI